MIKNNKIPMWRTHEYELIMSKIREAARMDPDLRIPGKKPVPWRRTYGPALNGQILDHGILLGL
jgi:hypothetical protein